MAISNKFGCLVLSTGNKTELALGYCTLYGDMSGGLSAIGDLNKTEVYELSKWINQNKELIPENIISKEPSAELAPNQVDPFDYELISRANWVADIVYDPPMTVLGSAATKLGKSLISGRDMVSGQIEPIDYWLLDCEVT